MPCRTILPAILEQRFQMSIFNPSAGMRDLMPFDAKRLDEPALSDPATFYTARPPMNSENEATSRAQGRGRWSKKDLTPKGGWSFRRMLDNGPERGGWSECAMCESTNVRYVHVMHHAHHDDLHVGCVCADYMSSNQGAGKVREDAFKRAEKAKRKAKQDKLLNRIAHLRQQRSMLVQVSSQMPNKKGGASMLIDGLWANAFKRDDVWRWAYADVFSSKKVAYGTAALAFADLVSQIRSQKAGQIDAEIEALVLKFEKLTGRTTGVC